jgi:uncharacterized protein YjbI with pentapeptide repeats
MVIQKLRGQRGDVRKILGAQGDPNEYINISDDQWGGELAILQDLTFHRVELSQQEITVNFVRCLFRESRFQRLHSSSHFWGAENRWERCELSGVNLTDVISPANVFEECRFEDVSLVDYRPAQTLFRGCHFGRLRLEGFRVVQNAAVKGDSDLERHGVQTAFVQCEFDQPFFSKCFFAGVAFESCNVTGATVDSCDFRGAISDQPWWRANEDGGDPFVAFLQEVVGIAGERLGRRSASFIALDRYLRDYESGRTKSRDYSAVLYGGSVPDRELDLLEDVLDDVEKRYPF